MLRLRNIKLNIEDKEEVLIEKILKQLRIEKKDLISYKISKKSIDSREKQNICYVYNVDVKVKKEKRFINKKNVQVVEKIKYNVPYASLGDNKRPVIVGSGPAGLLSALILAEAGLKPLIIEMGKDVYSRKKDIDKFWETGELLEDSNMQFGAGGAGTFSDGKLTTGKKDKRKEKLFNELIEAGAPKEIRYLGKPHLGTDILIKVVDNICKKIINLGGEILYETKFIDFDEIDNKLTSITVQDSKGQSKIECNHLILAIGHSARETFFKLYEKKINMKSKAFSVGVRVEHLQKEVNKCQYKEYAEVLDSASYKVNTNVLDERGVYTFCMCPGGVVVGASSEKDRVVTNGMSYYARDLENANSALLVTIKPEDFDGLVDPLAGIKFQRKLESDAFDLGGRNYYAPVQKVGDFLNGVKTEKIGKIKPTYLPGITLSNLDECLPKLVSDSLKEAIINLQSKFPIFLENDAILTAVESRSSSPVIILRDEKNMSNIYGIYPCGEGAGYAGGIVSAAIDGIKCSEKLIEEYNIVH